MEALLSFLSAIEEYQLEINASESRTTNLGGLSSSELAKQERVTEEAALAGAVLNEVGDGEYFLRQLWHDRGGNRC